MRRVREVLLTRLYKVNIPSHSPLTKVVVPVSSVNGSADVYKLHIVPPFRANALQSVVGTLSQAALQAAKFPFADATSVPLLLGTLLKANW